MFIEKLDPSYIVNQTGTSEGTQIKYYKDGYWYKQDSRGNEGLSEYLCSKLLTFSSLHPDEYILYEQGTINGRAGCRSKNFLTPDAELFTFYRLYYNEFGRNISNVISQMETMEERMEHVIAFIREICDLDITDYLRKTLFLDMLVLNEDRHLNNLAVLFKNDHFEPAPIFDQGVSLLTCNQSVNRRLDVADNVKRVVARPFSGSHEKMCEYLGWGFRLDVEGALRWLETEEDSFEKDVLVYQVRRYEGMLT